MQKSLVLVNAVTGRTNKEFEFGLFDLRHSVTGTVVAELPACGYSPKEMAAIHNALV